MKSDIKVESKGGWKGEREIMIKSSEEKWEIGRWCGSIRA